MRRRSLNSYNKWCILIVGDPTNSYQIHKCRIKTTDHEFSQVEFIGLHQTITVGNGYIFDDLSLALLYISKLESKIAPLTSEDIVEALKPIYEIERLKKENSRLRTDLNKAIYGDTKYLSSGLGDPMEIDGEI